MKLVSGFGVIFSLLVLGGCSNRGSEAPKLPESATFGWQLKSVTETKPEAAPEVVRQIGFARSWRAEYDGPGQVHVDVYGMKTEATGLEMMQQWKAAADTVAFFNARYFVVISWDRVDRAALKALVGKLEKMGG